MPNMQMDDLVLVSVDDHVIEPKDAFIKHFPERLKSKAPHVVRSKGAAGQEVDAWYWEGQRYPTFGLNAVVGRPRSEYGMEPSNFDQIREGTWDIKQRIDDMNVNGVLGSLNFPTFPSFGGKVFHETADKAMALVAVQAYNDWHILEWCAYEPGRMIPLAILPLWSVPETVAELKRVSKMGCHAVTFPDNPALVGLPSLHDPVWEPVWKTCTELQIVLNCHIGTGSRAAHPSELSPIDAYITSMPMSIANSAADWTFASFWNRYPNLRMCLSEGGIGWVPYFLERADFTYEHHHEWTFSDFGAGKPSDVFKRQIITCFIDDKFGLENLGAMNEDMVAWECDYPHSDAVWPKCPEYFWATVQKLTDAQINKVSHANVMREYNYDPFSILGGRANCTVGALRAKATHVDTSIRANLGGLKAETEAYFGYGKEKKPVTSGQILKMYASA